MAGFLRFQVTEINSRAAQLAFLRNPDKRTQLLLTNAGQRKCEREQGKKRHQMRDADSRNLNHCSFVVCFCLIFSDLPFANRVKARVK